MPFRRRTLRRRTTSKPRCALMSNMMCVIVMATLTWNAQVRGHQAQAQADKEEPGPGQADGHLRVTRALGTAASPDAYNFMFYFLVAVMMLACLVYNIFFKHHMEARLLAQNGLPETILRQDVIASDQDMNHLWECEVCCFKSYEAQPTCMLCGTDRSFKFVEKQNQHQQLLDTENGFGTKYVLYKDPKVDKQEKKENFKQRLSALTHRQQSARRRHDWIRERNEDGQFVWKRKKNVLDRQLLRELRVSGASSCSNSQHDGAERDSCCSNSSDASSVGIVSRLVVSPKNPNGRISFLKPEGSLANRCSEECGRFTSEELDQVSKLSFQQKQAWFVQHTAAMEIPWEFGHLLLEIERPNLLHQSCEQLLWASADQLHQPLRIKFANEPGVDAGGLVREWFTLMTREVFDDATGLFCVSGNGDGLMLNPCSEEASVDHLMYFQAIGRFLGRALFEGVLLDAHLALPICKHILGIPMSFSDLQFVDETLYKNLKWLRDNDNVEALCLDFTVTLDQGDQEPKIVDLVPNGSEISVTDENKEEYIDLRFKWLMATGISAQLASFVQGIFAVIPRELLSVFDHQELELLICGIPEIDVADWQAHTIYVGTQDEQVTTWFWEIIQSFSNERRARLLQFTTGSSRVPVQGFKALTMNDGRICPFAIQCVPVDECLYPRAHTCFNRIDLPMYSSENDLRIALTLVIQMEVTGFTIE